MSTHVITSSAGSDGTISPLGATTVTDGTDQVYTITPDSGQVVADVLVDGSSVGQGTVYTFFNVAANHTIAASFSPGTTVSLSLGTYLNLPVLTTSPEGGLSMDVAHDRGVVLLDNRLGFKRLDAQRVDPNPVQKFSLICANQTEAKALRDFVDARIGRAIPFWLPTWRRDLVLHNNVADGTSAITVDGVDYTGLMFPTTGARHHLAFWDSTGITSMAKVTAAAYAPADGYETLIISPPYGPGSHAAATIAGTNVCFLRYCRLENDAVTLRWIANGLCQADFAFREIPNEAPV